MRRTYFGRKNRIGILTKMNNRQKRFHGVIITRNVFYTAICIISAIVFLLTAWAVIKGYSAPDDEIILKNGMAQAVPFLPHKKGELTKITNLIFGADIGDMTAVIASASPAFSKEFKINYTDKKTLGDKKIKMPENNYTNKISILNDTDYKIDISEFLKKPLKFDVSEKNPSVLIVHTHASESYTPSKAYEYENKGNYRTQNTSYNMIRVGNELEKYLKANGINVIHDKTINDYPSYNDSYNKTENIIKKNLKEYPSLKFVFDIHRDAVGDKESKMQFTSTADGEKAAKVMIVCGTDTNLKNPLWRENLTLALNIQNYFETYYPSLMRPLNLRKERFNMHLTTGSLLFEIGTNYNTLDEALASARCLGKGLANIIKSYE